MFPSYPGFEDLPIHVQVEWQGRTRPVVARYEQWPCWKTAVLVCAFEDAPGEGEWLLLPQGGLHDYERPERYIRSYELLHGETTAPHPKLVVEPAELVRLHRSVRHAFAMDERPNSTPKIARLLMLSELPAEPRLALEHGHGLFWCSDGRDPNLVPFATSSLDSFAADLPSAQQALQRAWDDGTSDAHFAWRWTLLDDNERFAMLTGYEGDWRELHKVMEWVVLASAALWQLSERGWFWQISVDGEFDVLEDRVDAQTEPQSILGGWIAFLRNYFIPQGRAHLAATHPCVREFCGAHGCCIGQIQLLDKPTAHQQLEAKLALRDWLADKATPDQIAELLDC